MKNSSHLSLPVYHNHQHPVFFLSYTPVISFFGSVVKRFHFQKFLVWRIPSTTHDQNSDDAIKEFLHLSNLATRQRFYDDYVGRSCKYSPIISEPNKQGSELLSKQASKQVN